MTTPQALAAAMQRQDADRILLREMQETLRSELEKEPELQNLDTVDELTAVICEMCGLGQEVDAHTRAGLEAFRRHIAEPVSPAVKQRMTIRWKRFAAVAASVAGALLIGNAASRMALGDSLLSAGAKLIHGGIDISFSDSGDVSEEVQPDQENAFGIREACESVGFSPLIPQYFPEGYEMVDSFVGDEDPDTQDVIFWFEAGDDKHITLHYTHYSNDRIENQIGLPTADYELTETEINGITVFQVREDDFYDAAFRYDDTVYVLNLTNTDPEICDRMLYSFFDSMDNT